MVHELVDLVGTLPAHMLCDMSVSVQGKSGGIVAQVFLHRLDITARLQRNHGIRVPLRYNNDKPENPSNDGRFEGLSHLFHSFSNHEKAGQKS